MVEKYSQTIRLSNLKGLFTHGCDTHAKSKNMRRKYACIQKLASKVTAAEVRPGDAMEVMLGNEPRE